MSSILPLDILLLCNASVSFALIGCYLIPWSEIDDDDLWIKAFSVSLGTPALWYFSFIISLGILFYRKWG